MRRVWLNGLLGLIGLSALLILFATGAIRATTDRDVAESWRTHTLQVLIDAQRLKYLATSVPHVQLATLLQKISRETIDNPRQRANVASYGAVLERLPNGVSAIARTALADRMISEEVRLLGQRTQTAKSSAVASRHFTFGLTIFSVAMLALCAVLGVLAQRREVGRRRAEKQVLRAAAEDRALFELEALGIAQADPVSGRLAKVNERLSEITGYSIDRLLTMTIDDLRGPDIDNPDHESFAGLLAGGGPLLVDRRFRRRDKSTFLARVNVTLACGPDGTPLRAIVLVKDISERRTTGALLQTILEATPGLIYAKDLDGRMILANSATLALFGKPWSEVDGRTDAEILSVAEEGLAIMARDRMLMADGATIIVEEPVTWPNGTRGIWLSTKAPMRDANGETIGMVGISVDITARKLAEAELRQINETLSLRVANAVAAREVALVQLHEVQKLETIGRLTGGVAHDFNNLLTPIIGGLDLIQRRLPDADDKVKRLLSGAQQAGERARVLVARLLTFSRRQRLEPKPVDLDEMLDGLRDLIARSVGPTITVTIDVQADIAPVLIDPAQFELVLLNLAANSHDAMPEGGTLLIEAREQVLSIEEKGLAPGRYVCVSIVDDGSGMDEQTVQRAIEPFFSTKAQGKGAGLGLSMAHGFAAQSGGVLLIGSSMGRGTRVDILLPETEMVVERAISNGVATVPGKCRPLKILLVDDEELVRQATASLLTDLGHDVVQASTGLQALELIEAGTHFDMLVTDYLMPGMNGAELADRARLLRARFPVLMITGFANLAEKQRTDLAWLAKPFRQDDLAARIARLIRTHDNLEEGEDTQIIA
ncbi:MAG: hypothetical protein JWO15_1602 [Sphingomonadales bacterium]|nr:hypothetical protein [Sphingomonadales bacterium]